jgi:anionic cell wall polymer biosynthesis LytR-Cps2A-Psr (LCP) family protein
MVPGGCLRQCKRERNEEASANTACLPQLPTIGVYRIKEKPVKNKFDASAILLGIIVLLLCLGIVFAAWILYIDPIEESLSGDKVINTLFVIEDKGKPLCSYVLMYYPITKRMVIFDIPGEVGLILQRINRVDRIDTVYDPQRISVFEDEIENLLGIDAVNFSLVIELDNLGRIVDLIEGVELFIPSPVHIVNEEELILFPSGMTRLDGDKAKLYVSYELPEEDRELAVFRRQRFFLGLLKRLGERNEYLKHPTITPIFQTMIRTGMSQRVRNRLFDEFSRMDRDRINIQSVGGNIRTVSGQTLIFPLYNGNLIKDIVRQALSSLVRQSEGSITDRVYTVEVLNGTPTNGLAGRTAELLRGFGYDVISIGNADSSEYEETVIIDRSGFENVVRSLGAIIQCGNIRFEALSSNAMDIDMNLQNYEYRSDFTLIIGRDFNGRYVTGK